MPRKSTSRKQHVEPMMRLGPVAGEAGEYELLIYGDIGDSWWGESITAQSVAQQLNELDSTVATINVRINSYGGSVADGLAIYNALRRHKATKAVTVDGVAMSSASLIAMAGDTVTMPATSILMIHAPWGVSQGNANDMRQYADVLDTFSDAMADAYMAKSGMSRSEVLALLQDGEDHYYTGDEAVAAGFADVVDGDVEDDGEPDESARAFARTLLERISARCAPAKYAGLSVRAALRAPQTSSLPESTTTSQESELMPNNARNTNPAGAATRAAVEADQNRRLSIRGMFAKFMNRNDLDTGALATLRQECEDNLDCTPETAGQKLLARLGMDTEATANAYEPMRSASSFSASSRSDDFVRAAGDALAIRAGVKVDEAHPGARDVQSMGLPEIMRACVSRSGRQLSMSSHGALVRAAMTTSDFPSILENALNKVLRGGFEAEPSTHEAWTRRVTVPDFKPQSRPIIGSAPALELVLEGADYTHGAIDEDKAVPYQVGKFGRLIQLTWESLINDDLGAFTRMTQAMGQAAARKEADFVYAAFSENSGAGPTMQDSVALFHSSHGNLAASASAIDAAALGAARILLRRQTAIGGGAMNLPPRFLLVAPEHEQAAETLLAAAARSLSQGSDNALVPAWLAKLELVVEARLSDDAFYLMTSPAAVDTFERAWLEADGGPVFFEDDGFNMDSKTYKVRHVFGGRWLDWRGAVKVPIA